MIKATIDAALQFAISKGIAQPDKKPIRNMIAMKGHNLRLLAAVGKQICSDDDHLFVNHELLRNDSDDLKLKKTFRKANKVWLVFLRVPVQTGTVLMVSVKTYDERHTEDVLVIRSESPDAASAIERRFTNSLKDRSTGISVDDHDAIERHARKQSHSQAPCFPLPINPEFSFIPGVNSSKPRKRKIRRPVMDEIPDEFQWPEIEKVVTAKYAKGDKVEFDVEVEDKRRRKGVVEQVRRTKSGHFAYVVDTGKCRWDVPERLIVPPKQEPLKFEKRACPDCGREFDFLASSPPESDWICNKCLARSRQPIVEVLT